jgi:carboxymethylenebutenolidase
MHTETLDIGYLAAPDGGGPGVVIVHDVWGLYDHFRDVARRFAEEGFVALAVELYRDLGSPKIEDPGTFMRGLSDPDMIARIRLAARALLAHPANATKRVGVVGFCMGGMYALLASAELPDISAAVPFYGILSHAHGLLYDTSGLDPAKKPKAPIDAASDLECPLLAFFGTDDTFIPIDDVRELERRLSASPQPTEVVVYEGAGHAFFNDTRPAAYRQEAAADAWQRTLSFLRTHLAKRGGAE